MKRYLPVLFGLAAMSAARVTMANDIASENYAGISLDQGNTEVTTPYGSLGCAPTAATMGLQYLQNTSPFPSLVAADPYSTVVAVGNNSNMQTSSVTATSGDNMYLGAKSYLASQVPGQATVQTQIAPLVDSGSLSNTQPTEQFIFNKLQQQIWAVQIGVLWVPPGSGSTPPSNLTLDGGHALTVTGINWNSQANIGTLTFIDPDGGGTLTGLIQQVTYSGVTTPGQSGWNNTWLQLTYPNNTSGVQSGGASSDLAVEEGDTAATNDFGAGGAATADIAVVVAEQVPEPASIGLVIGAVSLCLLRRGRRQNADI